MEIIGIVILALSGLLLLMVGIQRLSNPIKTFAKSSGITVPQDADLLNELRGVASVQLFSGIIILLGTLMSQMTFASHLVAALVFLGFAVGRMVSMSADGKPNKKIAQGLIFELVLGAANLFMLLQNTI